MQLPAVEVNGTPPSLIGRSCSELVVEECWHAGVLDVPANVIWLRVDSQWHRLYFDCGIVFWRRHDGDGPEGCEMPELDSRVQLVDLGQALGVNGRTIEAVSTRAVAGGSEVAFRWDSGDEIAFRDVDDKTRYYIG